MNLCAGLPAGIEGTVHALVKDYAFQGSPAMEVIAIPPGSPGQSQATDPGLLTQLPEVNTYAIVIIDAQNGFNELN